MKRLSMIVIALIVIHLTACGGNNNEQLSDDTTSEKAIHVKEVIPNGLVRTGLAMSLTLENAQFQSKVVALTLDSSDIIVGASIDELQVDIPINEERPSEIYSNILTKSELGDDYGMRSNSKIGKEWYEQVESLVQFMIGKPLSDILNLSTHQKGSNYQNISDIPDLVTSVTIDVDELISVVADAAMNAAKPAEAKGSVKTGLALIAGSELYSGPNGIDKVEMNSYIAAVTIDATGAIVNADLNSLEVIVESKSGETNVDINNEWGEQARIFADYFVGEDVDFVALETAPTESFKAVLDKAIANINSD